MAEIESARAGFSRATWIVIVLAVLGWFMAVYAFTQNSRANDELTRALAQRDQVQQAYNQQQEAVGTIAELNDRIGALTPELQELTGQHTAAQNQADTLLQQVESLRAEESELQSRIDAGQAGRAALEQELTPLREELALFQQRRSELEQAVSDQEAELAQLGERVEQARGQEAELQQTLSQLTQETARLTGEAADSEASVQETRAELAELTETLEQSRSEHATLQADIATMQSEATTAEARLSGLQGDVSATEAQRNELQGILTTLTDTIAQRSQELAALENRIAETMATDTSESSSATPAQGAQQDDEVAPEAPQPDTPTDSEAAPINRDVQRPESERVGRDGDGAGSN